MRTPHGLGPFELRLTPVTFDRSSATVVDFPLRGEWSAVNTPAHRVPSHGTDYFGQRYAYDFARLDGEGIPCHPRSVGRHLTLGAPVSAFYCWDQPVLAAFDGRVIGVGDGWPDRERVALLWELMRVTFFPPSVRGADYRPIAGNFALVEGSPGVALYAHLRRGSVRAKAGDTILDGDPIGTVGNSGNTTMPHLHFHLMDGPDPLRANGVACVFRRYERLVDKEWMIAERDAPRRLERIRVA
jgi:murein DD-endopeptidase MepM/ murein hydrolase activator NlpD